MKPHSSFRYLFLIGFLIIASLPIMGAESSTITLEPGTPLFVHDTLNAERSRPIVITKPLQVPVIEQKIYRTPNHPLQRKHYIKKVMLPNKKTFWVDQQMRFTVDQNGKAQYTYLPYKYFMPLAILFAICFGISLICLIRRFQNKSSNKWLKTDYLAIISSILLQYTMLMILLYISKITVFTASDELEYFKVAAGLKNGDFSGPWRYTIGLPLFYIPFILIFNAKSFYDIETAFCFFNALILSPAYLVLTFYIIKKLCGKILPALTAVFLLQFMMFFYQYYDLYFNGQYTYKSFFAVITSDWIYYLHAKFLLFGFNAGSENVSMLLIFVCITICLYSSKRIRNLVFLSIVFALACLTRINNIFFAPLLVWLLWNQFGEKLLNTKFLVKFICAGAISFLAVFSIQLIINKIQFNSFFTFPYVLHDAAVYRGFALSCIPGGLRFLSHISLAYIVPGSLAMAFVKNRKTQLTLIFGAMPLFFFFCGYPALGGGSTRFVMISYSFFTAALVLPEFWEEISWKSRSILVAIIALSLLLTTPSHYNLDILLPWGWDSYSWGSKFCNFLNYLIPAISVLLAAILYKKTQVCLFALLFVLIYYTCSIWLIGPLTAGLLIYAVIRFGTDVFLTFKAQNLSPEK